MSIQYRVIIQPIAESDLENAYLYIAQESPNYASKWLLQIQSKVKTLETLPFRCPLAPENNVFDYEIRQLIIGQYSVLFTSNSQFKTIYFSRYFSSAHPA